MPRFHFHVRDGVSQPDHEGTDLADWRAAQFEALRLAGNLIAENAKLMQLGEPWGMAVTDSTGLVLFQLDFTICGAPALSATPLMRDGRLSLKVD